MGNTRNHVTQQLDTTTLAGAEDSEAYLAAEKVMTGLTGCWMALCFFEFFMMVIGSSVADIFAMWNLTQILLHLLGCVGTLWFTLDMWRSGLFWVLWTLFGLVPALFEGVIIVGAFKLNRDCSKNLTASAK